MQFGDVTAPLPSAIQLCLGRAERAHTSGWAAVRSAVEHQATGGVEALWQKKLKSGQFNEQFWKIRIWAEIEVLEFFAISIREIP